MGFYFIIKLVPFLPFLVKSVRTKNLGTVIYTMFASHPVTSRQFNSFVLLYYSYILIYSCRLRNKEVYMHHKELLTLNKNEVMNSSSASVGLCMDVHANRPD